MNLLLGYGVVFLLFCLGSMTYEIWTLPGLAIADRVIGVGFEAGLFGLVIVWLLTMR